MKDSLRFVYEKVENGWKKVYEAQSFQNACFMAKQLKVISPKKDFCVDN